MQSRTAEAQTPAERRATGSFSVRLLAAGDHHRGSTTLRAYGEIDLGTAPALRQALLPVFKRESGPVNVDLSEVHFMDLAGVHVLLDLSRRLEAEGRRLAIACHENGQVHTLLGLVGLLDALTVHSPSNDAVIDADAQLRSPLPGRRTRRDFSNEHPALHSVQRTPRNPGR